MTRPLVVLTTVNALIQRVPPRSLFDGRVLTLRPSGRIGLDRLQSFFSNNGYIRTDTVREPGEFAVRGGIVDLFPRERPSHCASTSSATRSKASAASIR